MTEKQNKEKKVYTPQYFRLLWNKPNYFYEELEPSYNPTYNTHYLQVKCIFCELISPELGPDRSHHCRVMLDLDKIRCIRCGFGSKIEKLLNQNIVTNKFKIEHDFAGSTLKRENKPTRNTSGPGITIPLQFLDQDHDSWQFLFNDGFNKEEIDDIIEHKGIFYCTNGKQYTKYSTNTTTGRLIFPIVEKGQRVGWQARFLPPAGMKYETQKHILKKLNIQKYLISPGFSKKSHPYNIDCLDSYDVVTAVEGIKKVWKTGPFSFATFGVGVNLIPEDDNWVNRCLLLHKKLLIIFDKNALDIANKICNYYISHGGEAQVITLPQDGPEDLDDYSRLEIHELIKTQSNIGIPFNV